MNYIFANSYKGFSHIKSEKPCQDFSSFYYTKDRTIITCADGHGGDVYIRSDKGSELASLAVQHVFQTITKNDLRKDKIQKTLENIKISILCTWNKLVENDIKENKIKKEDVIKLCEDDRNRLLKNPVKAYGTTLSGVVLIHDTYIIVSIGDTEVLGFKNGKIVRLIDTNDNPVANITYSMCQEDAYEYIKIVTIKENDVDGILLCTDGLSSPYQSYQNFNESFVKPMVCRTLINKNTNYVNSLIEEIASKLGCGDDVSLAFIINEKTNPKYYNQED